MLSLALVFLSTAFAGPDQYRACCDAVGASCPETLRAIGPGSQTVRETGANRITGMWRLSCSTGVRYDDGATTAVDQVPVDGTVIDRLQPGAAACYSAACSLPEGLCLSWTGSQARLVRCDTGAIPGVTDWARPAEAPWTPVVIGRDKVLRAVRGDRAQARTSPAPAGPPKIDLTGVDLSLPALPPDPCRPNGALMDASNQQHGEGNQAAMQGDWGIALGKYRAAISINSCNAFAWADLGESYLMVQEPTRARDALEVAVRLMPKHYRAWANLGRTEEKSGRRNEALIAYQRALELEPDDPVARQGLERVLR